MNRLVPGCLEKKPKVLGSLIAGITVVILIINGIGLMYGITSVVPHLLYIPIVLVAYYYPRRSIPLTGLISLLYLALVFLSASDIRQEILPTTGRIVMFILIAAVVSLLTLKIQESEQQFRGVAERSSDIILLTDSSGRAQYVSPSVKKLTDYDPSEITGHMPENFIHPDDIPLLMESVPRIIQGTAQELTLRMKRKYGDYVTFEFSAAPIIKEGQVSGIQIIGRDITERQKGETALRESEEKYRMLADYTFDWEFWIAPDETILYSTPSCERISGYTPQEFIEDKDLIRKILHPDDFFALNHHMTREFPRLQPAAVDFRIIHRNGDIRWIGHVCQPIYNAQGEFIGRRASNRDITARKQMEFELRNANRRLSDIIGFLPDPTMVIDASGKIVAWNRAMEKLTGIAEATMLGKGDYAYSVWFYGKPRPVLIDLVLHQDLESIGKLYPRYRLFGQTIRAEVETIRPDGTKIDFWLTATPLFNDKGETVGAIESLRDVTNQKAIARAWKESKNYLDAIINSISDPVFVKDRSHQFVTVNDGFCHFINHTREEILGKTDYDFFPQEEADIFRKKDEEVFSSHQINENEEFLTDNRGDRHTIVTKKSLYLNGEGEEFIVGIIRDISDRKQMETALREVNKKLNLLSGITRHDIRNQLLTLTAYMELSKRTLGNPEKTLEYIAKEERAAKAIERQIVFTKEYQDLGVKAPVWQSVSGSLKTAAGSLPMRDIRIVDELDGLEIYADPLFEKVFYNLIDNALRYGGKDMATIRFGYAESGRDLTISVEDDGTGISEEDKPRLFERGFGHHTGLGLFLSREILSITGITISENGETGKGARFEIIVPKGAYRFSGQ
jgi:PAS domain S-box-containing protein